MSRAVSTDGVTRVEAAVDAIWKAIRADFQRIRRMRAVTDSIALVEQVIRRISGSNLRKAWARPQALSHNRMMAG
jgi:hypothetical protein